MNATALLKIYILIIVMIILIYEATSILAKWNINLFSSLIGLMLMIIAVLLLAIWERLDTKEEKESLRRDD